MNTYKISNEELTVNKINEIISKEYKIELSEELKNKVNICRDFLNEKISKTKEPVYGINTGFGSLYNKSVSNEELNKLQENLIISHACGQGETVPKEIIKIMILLKIKSLSFGKSGVQLVTIQRLIDFFNNNIFPIVYQQGSLGASGDLAPLAHLVLPIIGRGEVYFQNEKMSAKKMNEIMKWESVSLQSKEGLALLNGTQFMSAYGVFNLIKAQKIMTIADKIAALSLEAYDGRKDPFFEGLHQIRPHKGQIETAKNILKFLEGSQIVNRYKKHVQDPYSFRCVPQVHGASKDACDYVTKIFTTEINSVTDNPTIFVEEDKIVSGGNFHGQPLALTADFLALAVAEIGNISERRTYRLIEGKRELPSFLVANPGLNSGFMIPQYTSASIVSQSKQLCSPASIDSIESSQGQEDHVSMGANAVTKAFKVIENTEKILAIELMNAAQAIEFRRPMKTSEILEKFLADYRQCVKFAEKDELMYVKINKSLEFLQKI